MTTKDKIKQYLKFKSISKNKFYSITGFSTSFLDSGKSIGVDKAKIIIEKFPDISIDWLIMDRGEMLVSQAKVAEPMPEIFRQILKEKDDRIEILIRDNERLKIDLKNFSANTNMPAILLNTSEKDGLDFGNYSNITDSKIAP